MELKDTTSMESKLGQPKTNTVDASSTPTAKANVSNPVSGESKETSKLLPVTINVQAPDAERPSGHLDRIRLAFASFWNAHSTVIIYGFYAIILIAYFVYLGFAVSHNFEDCKILVVLTVVAVVLVIYRRIIKRFLLKRIKIWCKPVCDFALSVWDRKIVKWIVFALIAIVCVVWIIVDTWKNKYRLISLAGLFLYLVVCFLFSTNPSKINWRPVIWGVALQFAMGFLLLRWKWGFLAFQWMSTKTVEFLEYAQKGTEFVYGFLVRPPNICDMRPVFAFTVLQTIIFFAAIVSVMYYYGIMQKVLIEMAWLVQISMGTTATESLNAVGCIFLGMTEAPLMIKPYLCKMTKSELNAVFTAGFACIAGSLFVAYVSFGACPVYLLSASVMSAPAALAVAKILLPETEESQLKRVEDLKLPDSVEHNVLEALSAGANGIVHIVLIIIANLIVYVALLEVFNDLVGWLAGLVGLHLTFHQLLGYCFYPMAFVMGVSDESDWEKQKNETFIVAQLIGTKTILNEFIAYLKLGEITMRNELSGRAQMIATYALCGFSNIGSIGIQLGTFLALCPEKKAEISEVIIRSMIGGSIACFMTACVAGLIVENAFLCTPAYLNNTNCTLV